MLISFDTLSQAKSFFAFMKKRNKNSSFMEQEE